MNKRLKITIEKFNKINYKKDDSKRIIVGTLKPNCDKSLKQYINKRLMSQIIPHGQKI